MLEAQNSKITTSAMAPSILARASIGSVDMLAKRLGALTTKLPCPQQAHVRLGQPTVSVSDGHWSQDSLGSHKKLRCQDPKRLQIFLQQPG